MQLGGALASLGGQLGLDISGARTQLRFYPKLVSSYWFLSHLAEKPSPTVTVFEMLEGRSPDSSSPDYHRLMDGVVTRLSHLVAIDVDDRANVFTLVVRLPTREAALATAVNAVSLVTDFNTHVRRLQASDNRRFVEQRADSAREDLSAAEDAVAAFLQRNKSYEQSPLLALQYQRLQRHVSLLQDVYVTLARNLEEARIDEVREAPVLTVVDPPHVTWRRAEPDRRSVVLTATGAVAAILLLWFLFNREISTLRNKSRIS